MSDDTQRRLAAIDSGDVVGYSRLIRADEEDTLAALKTIRADVVDPQHLTLLRLLSMRWVLTS